MERRNISEDVLKEVLKEIPKTIIDMLPETPEKLLKYATRVKEIYFSPSIKDDNIKKLMKEHLLSDKEYLKSFFYVMALTFYNKKSVENPEIAVVVAQTGSGKSHLTARILRENENFIFVDSDKYKHFRHDAKKIAKEYPVLYPFLTGPDAYDHADNIYQYAIDNKYNIIKETAPSPNKRLLGFYVSNDYKISVHILAVGNINSLLSIHERYELQILNGLTTAKLTPIIRHNESYNAMIDCIKQLIEEKSTEDISVYKRGIKKNEFEPIKVYPDIKYKNPIEAIEETRKNDNEESKLNIDKRIEMIINEMDNRNAKEEHYNQIGEVKKIVGVM